MQSMKNGHRIDGEQETEIDRSGNGVSRNGERLGLIVICDFDNKRVDNG